MTVPERSSAIGRGSFRAARRFVFLTALVVFAGCGDDDGPPPDAGDVTDAAECAADTTCDDGVFCNGAERCAAGRCVAGSPPCEGSICDEAADECTSCEVPDADGDGAASIACGGTDCDDTDPDVNPGATEVCDVAGVDEDCDPSTLGDRDIDGDGRVSSVCCNGDRCGLDCDDSNPAVYSGATEVCNGFDDDCDGSVDEGVQAMLWVDADRDGAGDPAMRVAACADTPGFVNNADDCDDTNPTANPAGIEACDEIDNDCDGEIDENAVAIAWYVDADGDGFGVSSGTPVISCTPVPGHAPIPGDCNDAARDVNPAAAERCNGRDDNCDGRADYRIGPGNFEDDDNDGFADAACPGGGGTDCDDRDGTVHPGAPELCDFRDNDCDGVIDGVTAMARWYVDSDGDGWGDDTQPSIESCSPQPGRAYRPGDCDDTTPFVRPGLVDGCDGIDQDCDGELDENSVRFAYYTDGDGDGWGAGAVTFACVPPMDATTRVGDCADDDDARFPSAPEDCNERDDDCDDRVDEGATLRTFFQDADRDGYGREGGTTAMACVAPTGFADNTDDCDDSTATRSPGAVELCNGVDDDCDDLVDGPAAHDACVYPNASGVCLTGGFCDLDSCASPFGNCDGTYANGCETDTRSDVRNCGACGMRCPAGLDCVEGTCADSLITRIRTGQSHVCVVRENGRVACWGSNSGGQIDPAAATGADILAPVAFDGTPPVQDVAYDSQSGGCAITTGGETWCWGNAAGTWAPALGSMPGPIGRTDRVVSVRLPALVPGASGARSIGTFRGSVCIARADGRVACWGSGSALGDGTSIPREAPSLVPGINNAEKVVGGNGICVLRTDGRVTCWGQNRFCGSIPGCEVNTIDIAGITSADELAGTGDARGGWCARQSGIWSCWGTYRDPTTGAVLGSNAMATAVPGIPTTATSLAGCGSDVMCAATPEVVCWGDNDPSSSTLVEGLLGRGLDTDVVRPIGPVAGGLSASSIAGGYHFFCAVDSTRSSVWCWGYDDNGALGDGTTETVRRSPTLVAF